MQKPRSLIKTLVAFYLNKYLPRYGYLLSSRDAIRPYGNNWENVGNYLFRLSEREIEKVALAMDYELLAFRYLNDSYIKGVEHAPLDSPVFQQVRRNISKKNQLCQLGLNQGSYSLIACVLFKTIPGEDIIEALQKSGYYVKILPNNPYRLQQAL